jgi:8-oxo-dGTP diphosphatase
MSLEGQRLQSDRYSVVPRTLCFLLHDDQILLLKLADERGVWGGKYNGVGGHIERGENPTSAVRREILEETGTTPESLELCGVVMIDTQTVPGIGLYVYVGEIEFLMSPNPMEEGTLHWVQMSELYDLPLVEDLPVLLPRALEAKRSKIPFSANYTYDSEGALTIHFSS